MSEDLLKTGYYAAGEPRPDIPAPTGYRGFANSSWHDHEGQDGWFQKCQTCKASFGKHDAICNACYNAASCGLYPLPVTKVSVYLCAKCCPLWVFV